MMNHENRLNKSALLISNRRIAEGIYAMELSEPGLAAEVRPGQFVMMAIDDGIEPFLRRPFSVAGIDRGAGTIKLVYQVTGKGSAMMSAWETGRRVDLLGPLGNGFTWDNLSGAAVLAGGGMGIAPLLPLAKALREHGKEVTVFAGARSLDLLFGLPSFNEYGCEVQIATEDGSGGMTGFATLPLELRLRAGFPGVGGALYACGPAPFLKAVADLCGTYKAEAQLSMEERMGCGFGACMGCSVQIRTADGIKRKRVCYDGPVFTAGEVVFDG